MRLFLILVFFFLSGCATFAPRASISDGDTHIRSNINSKYPATMEKEESYIEITHKKGDIVKTNDFTFYPVAGSTTNVNTKKVTANSGVSYEDLSKNISAVLKGTKPLQYAGIGILVIGIIIGVIFKVYVQGGLLAASGAGMVILQSTLVNPIWAWIMIGLVIILPAIWLFRLYKKDKTNKKIIDAIEDYKKENPSQVLNLENILRKKMDKSDKAEVKKVKNRL